MKTLGHIHKIWRFAQEDSNTCMLPSWFFNVATQSAGHQDDSFLRFNAFNALITVFAKLKPPTG